MGIVKITTFKTCHLQNLPPSKLATFGAKNFPKIHIQNSKTNFSQETKFPNSNLANMHLPIMFHLIISIIIFYSQRNNTESTSNPTPALSLKRRTLPTISSYSAKKEPFAENWRLLQVSAGSAAPSNRPSKELSKRPRPTGSAASTLTYTPYNKVWPSHQGPGTHFKEVSSWYATNQLNTSPNTLHTLTTQHWFKSPTIIQAPSPPPVPNPSPTIATCAAGQCHRQIKEK
jgi:hypothetical protein